jgi:hypothetical protein
MPIMDIRPRANPASPRLCAVLISDDAAAVGFEPEELLAGLRFIGLTPNCFKMLTQKPIIAKISEACKIKNI